MVNECRVDLKLITIPPSRTHNTISPFCSSLSKGPETEIHVIEVTGNTREPCVYVGGGTHGDELNGVRAVLEIADKLQEIDVNGRVILVPIQNPSGYLFRERLSPFDPIDPDWVHPGDPNGTYSKRMKYVLNQIAEKADCVIDLHTSGRGGLNNPMIYVPPETGNEAGRRSLELALAFGGDRIVYGKKEEDYGWPVRYAMPFVAVRDGRAGIYAEAGEGGASVPEEVYVNYFVNGVLNTLRSMGMLEGLIVEQGERRIVDPRTWEVSVRSSINGVFVPKTSLGSKVQRTQVLAEVLGIPNGREKLKAPTSGMVTFINTFGSVSKGERLFAVSE